MKPIEKLVQLLGGAKYIFIAVGGLSLIAALATIPPAIDSSYSLLDRWYPPKPIEITKTPEDLGGAPIQTKTYRIALDGPYFVPPVFSSDDRLLAAPNKDWSVSVFYSRTGKEAQRLIGHEGVVRSVDFSSDGRLVATGAEDGTARIWDLSTGAQTQVFFDGSELKRSANPISVLVAFVGTQMLAFGGTSDSLQVVNFISGATAANVSVSAVEIPEVKRDSKSLALSPEQIQASRARRDAIQTENAGRKGASQPIEALSVSPNGKLVSIVSYRATGDVHVFNVETGLQVSQFDLRGELNLSPRGVSFGNNNEVLFISGKREVGVQKSKRFMEVYRISLLRPSQAERVAAIETDLSSNTSRFDLSSDADSIIMAQKQAVIAADTNSSAQKFLREELFCLQRNAYLVQLDAPFLVTSYCQGGYGLLFERQ